MNGILYNKTDDLPGSCEGKEGSVYVIDAYGRCKIGCSRNPRNRIKGIETLLGYPIVWIVVFEPCLNYKAAESFMHRHFASYRQMGEWFLCNPWEVCNELGKIEAEKQDHTIEMRRLGDMLNKALRGGL